MKTRIIKMLYQGATYLLVPNPEFDDLSLDEYSEQWRKVLPDVNNLQCLLTDGSWLVFGKGVIDSAVFMFSERDFGEEE